MTRRIVVLISSGVLALASPAAAELCSIDVVPSATLLLPYFETDISDRDGINKADCMGVDTLLSINNAEASSALAHVTLWTDWSFPSFDFDVFLTGYDVQTVSLCQVIGRGRLPGTADEQNDDGDTLSPHGGTFSNNPAWDGSFGNCSGVFPYDDPAIMGNLLDRVQNAHAGYPIAALGGACVGEELNGAGSCAGGSCPAGTIARGFVTIDNANDCSTFFPSEAGYFIDGGVGVANNMNHLWGDWLRFDSANNFAQGDVLVHIEADPQFNATSTPTGNTFYGRYVTTMGDRTGVDNREPLGSSWGSRFLNGGAFDGGTTLTVWRDSTDDLTNSNQGWSCGSCQRGAGPGWCPLRHTQVVCFDEAEDAVELCLDSGSGGDCFPLETNRVRVGTGLLTPPWDFGWCFYNLNTTCENCPGNIVQSFVATNHDALGRFSIGLGGIEFTRACDLRDRLIDGDLGSVAP